MESYNFAGPGAAGFASAEPDLLGGHATSVGPGTSALDAGRGPGTGPGRAPGRSPATSSTAKHLWDVDLQPQFRAGLQLDLGPRPAWAWKATQRRRAHAAPGEAAVRPRPPCATPFSQAAVHPGRRSSARSTAPPSPGAAPPCRSAPARCCSPSASRRARTGRMKGATLMVELMGPSAWPGIRAAPPGASWRWLCWRPAGGPSAGRPAQPPSRRRRNGSTPPRPG